MIPAEGSRKSEKKNTVFLLRSYQAKTVERRRRSGARYLHMIFVLPGLFFPRDPLVPIKAFHLSLSLSLSLSPPPTSSRYFFQLLLSSKKQTEKGGSRLAMVAIMKKCCIIWFNLILVGLLVYLI
jgi:hypothetical protein